MTHLPPLLIPCPECGADVKMPGGVVQCPGCQAKIKAKAWAPKFIVEVVDKPL